MECVRHLSRNYIGLAVMLVFLSACSGGGGGGVSDTTSSNDAGVPGAAPGVTPPGNPPAGGPDIAKPPLTVSAVAGISGLADGAILGGPKNVTAQADASPNNASYAWSLTGATLPDAITGGGGSFSFNVPAAKDPTAADQYSLKLTATSTTGATGSKTINFQVYPTPAPKIAMQGACPAAGCPFNGPITFTVVDGGTYASDFKWQFTVQGKSAVVCDSVAEGGKVCVYTPTAEGPFTVSVVATGVGGSAPSNAVPFSVKKGVPSVQITGVAVGQKFTIAPQTLGSTILVDGLKLNALDAVAYTWTVSKGALPPPPTTSTDASLSLKDPDVYLITLQVTVNGKPSNTVAAAFTLLSELTVKIVGQSNLPLGIAVPAVVPVSSKQSTVKAVTNLAADYGPATYAWVMKKPDQSVVKLGGAETQDVTFDKPGAYAIRVNVTAGDKMKFDIANTTAAYQAVATIAGIQNKHSYLKRSLSVSSKSEYADTLSWTLFDAANQGVPPYVNNPADHLLIDEKDLNFGAYTLQLTANNVSGLNASIDNEDFNIRVAEKEFLLPFKPGAAQSVYAFDDSNIFVGDDKGLIHLGEDGVWANLLFVYGNPVSAIWARSANEIYAAQYLPAFNMPGTIFKYTAKDGWQELIAGEAFPGVDVVALTGNDAEVVALSNDGRVYVLRGAKWEVLSQDQIDLVSVAPDKSGTLFVVGLGRLFIFNANLNLVNKIPLPVNQNWTAMLAMSQKLVYLANAAGEIYSSDGNAVTLIGVLPKYKATQQYAKLLWKSGSRVYALTQNAGKYAIAKTVSEQMPPSDFGVDSASATDNTIVAISKGEVFSPKLNAQNQLEWVHLFPSTQDSLMQPVYADKTTTARSSGETVYVLNAKSTLNNMDSYLQRITPDGARTALPVPKPIIDLFGVKGGAYFVTDDGLFTCNGTDGTISKAAQAPAKVLALDGEPTSSVKPGVFYAMTESGLFWSDGHLFKPVVTLQNPLKATALHMLDGKWILATTTGTANYITVGDLAQDNVKLIEPASGGVSMKIVSIGGPNLDHLFAIGNGVDAKGNNAGAIYQYDKTTKQWNPYWVPLLPAPVYRQIQHDATHLYFIADEVMVIYELATKVIKIVKSYDYAFYAQGSPDYVYHGEMDVSQTPFVLYFLRSGPMQ